jgi:hypothetical protein
MQRRVTDNIPVVKCRSIRDDRVLCVEGRAVKGRPRRRERARRGPGHGS